MPSPRTFNRIHIIVQMKLLVFRPSGSSRMLSWTRLLFSRPSSGASRQAGGGAQYARPGLEGLEGRLTPAAFPFQPAQLLSQLASSLPSMPPMVQTLQQQLSSRLPLTQIQQAVQHLPSQQLQQ